METIELKCRTLTPSELLKYEPSEKFCSLRQLWSRAAAQDQSLLKLFVLRVTFINTSTNDVEFEYSNDNLKTELLNLRIESENGHRILPTRNVQIRPKKTTSPSRLLRPREEWFFDLVGEVVGCELIFPGARYKLSTHEQYTVYIVLGGKTSSKCVLNGHLKVLLK